METASTVDPVAVANDVVTALVAYIGGDMSRVPDMYECGCGSLLRVNPATTPSQSSWIRQATWQLQQHMRSKVHQRWMEANAEDAQVAALTQAWIARVPPAKSPRTAAGSALLSNAMSVRSAAASVGAAGGALPAVTYTPMEALPTKNFYAALAVTYNHDQRRAAQEIRVRDAFTVRARAPQPSFLCEVASIYCVPGGQPSVMCQWYYRVTEMEDADGVPDGLRTVPNVVVLSDYADKNPPDVLLRRVAIFRHEGSLASVLAAAAALQAHDAYGVLCVGMLQSKDGSVRSMDDALRDRLPPLPASICPPPGADDDVEPLFRAIPNKPVSAPTIVDLAEEDASPSLPPPESVASPVASPYANNNDAAASDVTAPSAAAQVGDGSAPRSRRKRSTRPTIDPMRYDITGRERVKPSLTLPPEHVQARIGAAYQADVPAPSSVAASTPVAHPTLHLAHKEHECKQQFLRALPSLTRWLHPGLRVGAPRAWPLPGGAVRHWPAVLITWRHSNPAQLSSISDRLQLAVSMLKSEESAPELPVSMPTKIMGAPPRGTAIVAFLDSPSLHAVPVNQLQFPSFAQLMDDVTALAVLHECEYDSARALQRIAELITQPFERQLKHMRKLCARASGSNVEMVSATVVGGGITLELAFRWMAQHAEIATLPRSSMETGLVSAVHLSERPVWSVDQQLQFAAGFARFGKYFSAISAWMDGSKTTAECAAYYYRLKHFRMHITGIGDTSLTPARAAPTAPARSRGGYAGSFVPPMSSSSAESARTSGRSDPDVEHSVEWPINLATGDDDAAARRPARERARDANGWLAQLEAIVECARGIVLPAISAMEAAGQTRWCSTCRKLLPNAGNILICCNPRCTQSVCDSCFRKGAAETMPHATTVKSRWKLACNNAFWVCFLCVPPTPTAEEIVIYDAQFASQLAILRAQQAMEAAARAAAEPKAAAVVAAGTKRPAQAQSSPTSSYAWAAAPRGRPPAAPPARGVAPRGAAAPPREGTAPSRTFRAPFMPRASVLPAPAVPRGVLPVPRGPTPSSVAKQYAAAKQYAPRLLSDTPAQRQARATAFLAKLKALAEFRDAPPGLPERWLKQRQSGELKTEQLISFLAEYIVLLRGDSALEIGFLAFVPAFMHASQAARMSMHRRLLAAGTLIPTFPEWSTLSDVVRLRLLTQPDPVTTDVSAVKLPDMEASTGPPSVLVGETISAQAASTSAGLENATQPGAVAPEPAAAAPAAAVASAAVAEQAVGNAPMEQAVGNAPVQQAASAASAASAEAAAGTPATGQPGT